MKVNLNDYEEEMEGVLLLPCQKNLERMDDADDMCTSVTCRCSKHKNIIFNGYIYLDNETIDNICRQSCPERLR